MLACRLKPCWHVLLSQNIHLIYLSRLMTKQTKWLCAQRRLRSAYASAKSSLVAQWVAKDPRVFHADSEDSDQTGRMPRLIWVFARRTVILLFFSWGGSFASFVCIFLTQFFMEGPHCLNFRIITAVFGVSNDYYYYVCNSTSLSYAWYREWKFVQMCQVTWPCSYMIKKLQKSSSSEPRDRWL